MAFGISMIPANNHKLSDLMPSLGYFGTTGLNALTVQCGHACTAIRLTLQTDDPEILNILGIKAFKNGSAIDLHSLLKRAHLSSDYFDNPAQNAVKLLDGKGIHSKTEKHPTWEIELTQPVDIDYLQVSNRPDEWGKRSKSLKISVCTKSGAWEDIFSSYSGSRISDILIEALMAARFLDASELKSANELRIKLINAISSNLEAGTISLRDTAWNKLIEFTQVWTDPRMSRAEWNIFAAKVLSEMIFHSKNDLSDYWFVLFDKRQIECLNDAINRVAPPAGLGKFAITRHGLQPARLGTHRDTYMKLLAQIISQLEELERQPFIAYGTLLGARREGKFIDHDDDVDLLYLLHANTPEARQVEMDAVFEHLRNCGFPVHPSKGGLNAHVFGKDKGTVIDIFPCWIDQGRIYLHMEKMAIRDIPAELIYPRSTLMLNTQTMPGPAYPDGFLKERYGDKWNISDPYFEWPWRLNEN